MENNSVIKLSEHIEISRDSYEDTVIAASAVLGEMANVLAKAEKLGVPEEERKTAAANYLGNLVIAGSKFLLDNLSGCPYDEKKRIQESITNTVVSAVTGMLNPDK